MDCSRCFFYKKLAGLRLLRGLRGIWYGVGTNWISIRKNDYPGDLRGDFLYNSFEAAFQSRPLGGVAVDQDRAHRRYHEIRREDKKARWHELL